MFSLLALLVACASLQGKMKPKGQALDDYGAAIRWSEFDTAQEFLDPVERVKQPLTDLETERLKQIQVTGYDVKRTVTLPDGSIEQLVEIRLIGKNTQLERTVVDHQHWRWDPDTKQFWLTTGLPDFSAH
jgi:hypothetical protein